ncbi:MAG: HAD family hydrolase [Clostridia bacterium]|nr:HAD family hydrolase [Clostridia bacterium]
MPYQTAIFDLDGTLLDTLEDLYLAVNHALTRHAFPLRTRDEVRAFVGNGVEQLIRRAVPEGTDESATLATLADFKATYAAICEEHTAPYDGIPDLLRALRDRGIRIAVVSNKFDEAVKQLCTRYFGDLVEVAVGERPGVQKKPAPDTVFEAMRLLNVTAEGAVYIGDSDVDIETAKNCEMPCLSVTWGFRDAHFLTTHGATILAHTPADLLQLLTE